MSDFKFSCPVCGQKISCDTGYSGRQINCPSCQKPFTVPAAPAAAISEAAAPPAPPAAAAVPRTTAPPAPSGPSAERSRPAPRPLPFVPLEPEPEPVRLPGATASGYSRLAMASLLCSTCAVAGWIPGIICGHMAKAQVRRNPLYNGEGMATAGLAISYAFLGLMLTAGSVFGLVQLHFKPIVTVRASPDLLPASPSRVVDEVVVGQSASESAHGLRARGQTDEKAFVVKPQPGAPAGAGGDAVTNILTQRTALRGGSFGYRMKVLPTQPMSVNCRYWGGEKGIRTFDIVVNDEIIATQTLSTNAPGQFMDVEYRIPQSLTAGQNQVQVEFQAHKSLRAGEIFVCQTLKR